VTNLRVWFDEPLSPLQILSWLSLIASLYLVVAGFSLLGLRAAEGKGDPVVMIESGIYQRIRHPIYSSLLFLGIGAFLKMPSLFSSILLFGVVFTLVTTARAEESVNKEKFGSRYREYEQRTKMFVPYVF
jgi:protein-S-isoprenylcysteine O-methyltransferase Ste14